MISDHKKEFICVSHKNEFVKEKVSLFRNDLKKKEYDLYNLKKQLEDLKDWLEDGKMESKVVCQKIVKLIENLNYLQNNIQQVRMINKFISINFFSFWIIFIV